MKDISILFNFNENDFASYNINIGEQTYQVNHDSCLLYTSPSPRD